MHILQDFRSEYKYTLALTSYLLYFGLLLFRLFFCLLGQSFKLLGCKLLERWMQTSEINCCHNFKKKKLHHTNIKQKESSIFTFSWNIISVDSERQKYRVLFLWALDYTFTIKGTNVTFFSYLPIPKVNSSLTKMHYITSFRILICCKTLNKSH